VIVSHQHRFVFLRIPKTASTSIQIELSKVCGPEDVITPMGFKNDPIGRVAGFKGPQNFQRFFGAKRLQDWFRILILRKSPKNFNHVTALQAQKYLGRTIWDSYYKFCVVRNPFDRAISLYYWHAKNTEDMVDLNQFILGLEEKKISAWHRFTINGQVAMDLICRYENLQSDLDLATTKIGIPPLSLPHAKSSHRKDRQHYSQLINSEARNHIERLCMKEINAFNYHWNPNS